MNSDEDPDEVEFGEESPDGAAGNWDSLFESPDTEEARDTEATDLVTDEDGSEPAADATGAVADDIPFSEAAKEAQRRRNAPSSPDEPFDEEFTEVDIDTVDTDSIWEELESEVDDPFGAAEEVDFEGARNVHVISKRSFCQRCRYFSEPPEVYCNHEGTEIIEAVDDDRFRVADCPMVLDDDSTIDVSK